MTKGLWLYGKAGEGKSFIAESLVRKYGDFYRHDVEDKGWWDKYHGEENVLLQDFRGGLKYSELLNLVDRYAHTVPRRNVGTIPFVAKRVVVTAAGPPSAVYQNLAAWDGLEQIHRRFLVLRVEGNRIFEHDPLNNSDTEVPKKVILDFLDTCQENRPFDFFDDVEELGGPAPPQASAEIEAGPGEPGQILSCAPPHGDARPGIVRDEATEKLLCSPACEPNLDENADLVIGVGEVIDANAPAEVNLVGSFHVDPLVVARGEASGGTCPVALRENVRFVLNGDRTSGRENAHTHASVFTHLVKREEGRGNLVVIADPINLGVK